MNIPSLEAILTDLDEVRRQRNASNRRIEELTDALRLIAVDMHWLLMAEAADTIDELRRDAERYRWLRNNKFIWSDFGYIRGCGKTVGLEFHWFPTASENPCEKDLDQAIDAAIKESK